MTLLLPKNEILPAACSREAGVTYLPMSWWLVFQALFSGRLIHADTCWATLSTFSLEPEPEPEEPNAGWCQHYWTKKKRKMIIMKWNEWQWKWFPPTSYVRAGMNQRDNDGQNMAAYRFGWPTFYGKLFVLSRHIYLPIHGTHRAKHAGPFIRISHKYLSICRG